ncbi:MAG: hypothetical protein ACQESP_01265 [Candidatus Muiribacteriota bacterium]
MKKLIYLLFIILFPFVSFAMPSIIQEEDEFKLTTFFKPLVFVIDEDNNFHVEDEDKLYNYVSNSQPDKDLEDKEKFIFSGAVIASLDFYRFFKGAIEKEESIIKAISNNLDEYFYSFKEGYKAAHDFLDEADNKEELLELIYFRPSRAPGSEASFYFKRGYDHSDNYISDFYENIRLSNYDSDRMINFIKNYAYALGIMSYIKTNHA